MKGVGKLLAGLLVVTVAFGIGCQMAFAALPSAVPAAKLKLGQPGAAAVAKPDLIISDISVNNASIVAGTKDSKVTFTVMNQGQAPVEGDIRCVIVGKTGYMTVPGGLPAGKQKNYSFLVGHDNEWPVGHYSIQVKADEPNAIPESNEDNNVSQPVVFDVVAPPQMGMLTVETRYTGTQDEFQGGHITVTDNAGHEVGNGLTRCQVDLPVSDIGTIYHVTCVVPAGDFARLHLENQIEREGPRDVCVVKGGTTETFWYGKAAH